MADTLISATDGTRLNGRGPRFRDPDLPLDDRVAALLAELTLPERIGLLHSFARGIARLDIAPYDDHTEVLHGVSRPGVATVFPEPIGLGATWNPELMARVGTAVGDEARGWQHRGPGFGLNVWGPVVNLLRDPRWGRNEEGYAEDPYLTAEIGSAYCRGMIGAVDGPVEVWKTAPTLKHFFGYGHETALGTRSVSIPPRVLWEYDLKPFQAIIERGLTSSVMLAFNTVNGRPHVVSPYVQEILRGWDERIAVISDAWAPTYLVLDEYYPDRMHGYAAALRAGLDMFVDQDDDPTLITANLAAALDEGLIDQSHVDEAVRRVLRLRFLVGEFDPPERASYPHLTDAVIDCAEHRRLAADAARQGVVLLKNDGPLLPMDPERVGTVAVIGPSADRIYRDWYSAATLPYETTPLAAVRDRIGDGRVVFTEGADQIALRAMDDGTYLTAGAEPDGARLCLTATEAGPQQTFEVFDWGETISLRSRANSRFVSLMDDRGLCNDKAVPGGWVIRETFTLEPQGDGWLLKCSASNAYVAAVGPDRLVTATAQDRGDALVFAREILVRGADEAAELARNADAAIVLVGTHPMIGARESQDRREIALPAAQDALVRAVRGANENTTMVVVSGYPFTVTWAAEHVPALVWSCHAGQELGPALAAVLFGDFSPSGRLTQSWPRSADHLGDLFEYDIIKGRKTYLYSDHEPLFSFGHGLGYTSFRHSLRAYRHRLCPEDSAQFSITVTNTGPTAGAEVVQLYWRMPESARPRPHAALCRFQRVHLAPGESTVVRFELPLTELAYWDVDRHEFVVEPGRYEFMIGRSARDWTDVERIVVRGMPAPPRDLGRRVSAVDFDAYDGVEIVDDGAKRADAVAATRPGAWVCFRDVELSSSPRLFEIHARRTEPGWAAIEVRLDDPVDGELLAVAPVLSGAAPGEWAAITAPVGGASGRRDVYLTCTDRLELLDLRLRSEVVA